MASIKIDRIEMKALAFATTLLSTTPVLAVDSSEGHQEPSLKARLTRSEERVEALQQRVEQLERLLNALTTAARTNVPRENQASSLAQAPVLPARAPIPPPAAGDAGRTSRRNSAAPGAFEVDEAAAQRALERTLTQAGALVMPPGVLEITPNFRYVRQEYTSPFATALTDPLTGAADLVLAERRHRSNDLTVAIDLRLGLPLDSQLEASVPYNYVRVSEVDDFGNTDSKNASAMGDVSLGLAKNFLHESGFRPDLVGRLTYNFGNGEQQDGIASFDSGFRQLQAEIVALKRQDPLAFTATLFYTRVFEEDSVKPGDGVGITLGAALAASPATSLQFAFSQIHQKRDEIDGTSIPGSDQTYGLFIIGASSVLSRDMTVVSQFGIGLGDDAPDYNVSIRLPILF